jgi:hypothetical protein
MVALRPSASAWTVAAATRQAERYGEDPVDFAGQPRLSFRVDPEHVYGCR